MRCPVAWRSSRDAFSAIRQRSAGRASFRLRCRRSRGRRLSVLVPFQAQAAPSSASVLPSNLLKRLERLLAPAEMGRNVARGSETRSRRPI